VVIPTRSRLLCLKYRRLLPSRFSLHLRGNGDRVWSAAFLPFPTVVVVGQFDPRPQDPSLAISPAGY
jgi:hypothetical protein